MVRRPEAPSISAEICCIRGRREERIARQYRPYRDHSAASLEFVCRRITARLSEATFKTANTKMFCWIWLWGRLYYLKSHEESVCCRELGLNSLRPCKIACWKAAWERQALLKVAEGSCEIQSNPVPMERGNCLEFWIRAAVEGGHPRPRIHVPGSALPCLSLAGPPLCGENTQGSRWIRPACWYDNSLHCVYHHRAQSRVNFTGFVMHMAVSHHRTFLSTKLLSLCSHRVLK